MKTLFLFFLLVAGLRAEITIVNTSSSILTFGFCAPGANLNSVYQISFSGGRNYYTLTNPCISNYTDSYGVCNVCIFMVKETERQRLMKLTIDLFLFL